MTDVEIAPSSFNHLIMLTNLSLWIMPSSEMVRSQILLVVSSIYDSTAAAWCLHLCAGCYSNFIVSSSVSHDSQKFYCLNTL